MVYLWDIILCISINPEGIRSYETIISKLYLEYFGASTSYWTCSNYLGHVPHLKARYIEASVYPYLAWCIKYIPKYKYSVRV